MNGPDLLENCSECCQFDLSEYPVSIVMKAALTAATSYIVKVVDKFNNAYSFVPTVADSDGNLTLVLPNTLPAQWFNRSAGMFRFEASKTAQPFTPETLTFGGETYSCIWVQFVNDNGGINTIQ